MYFYNIKARRIYLYLYELLDLTYNYSREKVKMYTDILYIIFMHFFSL